MRAIILTNDKKVVYVNVEPGKTEFAYKKGLYVIDPRTINRRILEGVEIMDSAEAIYFEATSTPIPIKQPGPEASDPSNAYLGAYVIQNALDQTGQSALAGTLTNIYLEAKKVITIRNIFLAVLIGSIAYNLFQQYLAGVPLL